MRVEKTDEFRAWLDGLTDPVTRARVQMRIERLIHGNPGQHRNLPNGVSELKIDLGPGYRVYYSQRRNGLLVLLGGGDKSSQQRDIARAGRLARDIRD
ncbi:MAG: type II toxin-antitoxin system RelE/ParE family toxin [Gammaproteobacteria bacterium]